MSAPIAAENAERRARARQAYADKKAAAAALDGAARPRRANMKTHKSNLLMPFHDIADDPYFIRV